MPDSGRISGLIFGRGVPGVFRRKSDRAARFLILHRAIATKFRRNFAKFRVSLAKFRGLAKRNPPSCKVCVGTSSSSDRMTLPTLQPPRLCSRVCIHLCSQCPRQRCSSHSIWVFYIQRIVVFPAICKGIPFIIKAIDAVI